MFEAGLLGSFLGGVFRIIPEILKWIDKKNEREHELKMLQAEMDFAKVKGEIEMHKVDTQALAGEVEAMGIALAEQGETARAAGWFVAALSALVRPIVTYWFVILYSAVKIAVICEAFATSDSNWKEVLINTWSSDDMAMLMLVLTFWFVGRVWERDQKAG